MLATCTCPSCGCHKASGSGLIVEYGKVRLNEIVAVKGWFGRTKYKDKLNKTVWRIHNFALYTAAGVIFSICLPFWILHRVSCVATLPGAIGQPAADERVHKHLGNS